ncbi:MAG: hypothetical protein F6K28_34565 [Microcoleus sp. SIO2G3]|nr:hypothetical protein [Microcoleus sp. SIO2G3]
MQYCTRELLEWQQGFYGSLIIGLILLGILTLHKRFTKQILTAALAIIFGDFLLKLVCLLVMVCSTNQANFVAPVQGLAAVSLYRALRTTNHSKS